MGVILREVIPDGTQYGELGEFLPDWFGLEFGQDVHSPGAITFKYANDGANFDRLKSGIYVTPIVDGNRMWRDSIFRVEEVNGIKTPSADAHMTTFAGSSLQGRLEKVRWMPAIGSVVMDSLAFKYNNYTPGQVIRLGVENYWSRARNQFKDPTNWLLDARTDDEADWKYRVDEEIEPTTSITSVIQKYQEVGIATAWFDGFVLKTSHYDWYKEPGKSADKTASVELRLGVNLIGDEYSESIRDLCTAVLVKGAVDPFAESTDDEFKPGNNCAWVIADQDAIDRFGYHEHVLDVSEASTQETLTAAGTAYLNAHLEPRYSKTYTMTDNLHDPRSGQSLDVPRALVDFQCGDQITVHSADGSSTQRVYAIAMSFDSPDRSNISITLNDFFADWQEMFDQRLKRLGG